MDNKITKERIGVHLEYDWLKYLIFIAVSVFAVYMLFYQINVNREFEQINVFVTAYGYNVSSSVVADEYLAYIKSETGDTTIRSASIEYQNPTSSEYSTLYSTHGLTADILFLSKSQMDAAGVGYLHLTDEMIDEFVPEGILPEYYIQQNDETPDYNGNRYGIRVDNLAAFRTEAPQNAPIWFNPAVLGTEEELDSEFYMVVNRSSVNLGRFNAKKKDRQKYADEYQTLYFIGYFLTAFG